MILTLLTMCFFFIYGQETSQVFVNSADSTLAVFLLLLLYGTSVVPLSYLYSMAFENHSTAQISIMIINFFTGFVFVLAYFVMNAIPFTQPYAASLVHFFRFFPGYLIGEGLINVSIAYLRIKLASLTGRRSYVKFFDWAVSGRNLTFLLVESIGYFLVVLLTELPLIRRLLYTLEVYRSKKAGEPPSPLHPTDYDVLQEEELCESEDPSRFSLFLRDIKKTYPQGFFGAKPKFAVRGLSLAIQIGERFGLLGINGAGEHAKIKNHPLALTRLGKSTTLGILTGDIQATSGDAFVEGLPLADPETRNSIGFCPQVDPLLELMTGYETLWFFGRIRGIHVNVLRDKVQSLIEEVGLLPFANKPCGTYSGGNKRKLSLAVALIGDPKILLLDEPSSGMDPEARRQMWNVISAVSLNRSVILTTHSMEECEALCTRLGIMVSGRLKCLGANQHLKSRFGKGYELEIRCSDDFVEESVKLCYDSIPGLVLKERHGSFLRFFAPASINLESAFRALEQNKEPLGILNYSMSQSSLEQVFIKFAREQEEEELRGLGSVLLEHPSQNSHVSFTDRQQIPWDSTGRDVHDNGMDTDDSPSLPTMKEDLQ